MTKLKIIISLVSLLLLTHFAYAQTDITPSRYDFANQSTGAYSMDKQFNSGNPPNYDADVKDYWNNGFITIGNPNMGNSLEFTGTTQGDIVNSYFQILDMGGEVGKVLCMKGSDSTFPYGTAGYSGFWLGWWNMSIYADTTLSDAAPFTPIPANTTIRMRIVFNIHQNTASTTKFFAIQGYSYAGNNGTASSNFTSSDFLTDDSYDTTKWIACEYDYSANESSAYPLRFALAMGANAKTTTLLIKSITMTANPTGTAVEKTFLTFDHNSTPTSLTAVSVDKIDYSVSMGQLNISNLEKGTSIQVYSMTGQLVHQSQSQDEYMSIPMKQGVFVVKAGMETFKVLVP